MVEGDGSGMEAPPQRVTRRATVRVCSNGKPRDTRISVLTEDGEEIQLDGVTEVLYRVAAKERGVLSLKFVKADVDLLGTTAMERRDAPWFEEDEESEQSEGGQEREEEGQ